jgi:uncharacterized protein
MTPEERQLINGLFDRMRSFGTPEKDRDAEALINQAVRATPDAAYMLVQSVLVQENALQEAGSRIQDLEEQVRELQGGGRERTSSSGSFLGGLLGTGRAASEPRTGSVPQVGARAAPSAYDERRPWSAPQSGPQQSAPPPQASGGGFLRSAMTTAAGVAGGVLAAGAIRDMLGGNAHANPTPTANATPAAGKTEPTQSEQSRLDAEDDARQDALDDESSWDSGDSGGDDIEI